MAQKIMFMVIPINCHNEVNTFVIKTRKRKNLRNIRAKRTQFQISEVNDAFCVEYN